MEATVYIVPSQLVYMKIPHKMLRDSVDGFVDRLIPGLSHNPIADSAKGYGHRYIAGHDLLLDVPRTFSSHGPVEGLRHAGHVLLTDFPTKAGIPIPGFSQSGLGHLLEKAGIHEGWVQVNIFDTGWGVIAFTEGASDLAQALHGTLTMDWGTSFDTFVEGSAEIYFALSTQNPFLLAGGVENILAGLVSTWNTLTVYVDPLDFFGAAGTSALIGFVLAHGLAGENLTDSGKDAIRSGTMGALYSLSPAFGFGALAGFSAYRLGGLLAKQHNKEMSGSLSIDEESYRLLMVEVCKGNTPVRELLEAAMPRLRLSDNAPKLQAQSRLLESNFRPLHTNFLTLGSSALTLQDNAFVLLEKCKKLPNDPKILTDLYQSTLVGRRHSTSQ